MLKKINKNKQQDFAYPENRHNRLRILLHVLNDAVAQLLVVQRDALGLVEGDECLLQEQQVLLFQGNGEPVDDRPQDLQQLPY